jgi:hypothetical protein
MVEPSDTAPPFVAAALAELAAAAADARIAAFDPLATSFARLQPLLGRVASNKLQLLLGAMWGARLQQHGALWFPHREAALGAALGLPDVMLTVFPLELAAAAVAAGDLAALDRREAELGASLRAARGASAAAGRLDVDAYRRRFDPGFVAFVVVDEAGAGAALQLPLPEARARLQQAIAAAAAPPNVQEALVAAWLDPLEELDGTLGSAAARAPRSVEALVRLFAGVDSGGPADESFWADAALPLVVPRSAGEAPRVLGVFAASTTRPRVAGVARPRLFAVDAAALPASLEVPPVATTLSPELRAIAMARLAELSRLRGQAQPPRLLAFQRLTETQLAAEAAAVAVAGALRA